MTKWRQALSAYRCYRRAGIGRITALRGAWWHICNVRADGEQMREEK